MKILIGSPVRQDEGIFKEYLESLDKLIIPNNTQVDKYFILNDCDTLAKFLKPNEYEILNTGDEYICDEETHHWNHENLSKMSILRNKLIDKVLEGGYDYFFMVDSDLILHPYTLMQLLSDKKDLVANIFWTQQGKGAWANCWDYDQCGIEDVFKWARPGIYEIGGTGACFLISRKVLESGVNYSPINNLKCITGEDRYFCISAACHGFKLYIDTNYPASHLYRMSDYENYILEKRGGADGITR